jgi:hypothetical protein
MTMRVDAIESADPTWLAEQVSTFLASLDSTTYGVLDIQWTAAYDHDGAAIVYCAFIRYHQK